MVPSSLEFILLRDGSGARRGRREEGFERQLALGRQVDGSPHEQEEEGKDRHNYPAHWGLAAATGEAYGRQTCRGSSSDGRCRRPTR